MNIKKRIIQKMKTKILIAVIVIIIIAVITVLFPGIWGWLGV